MPSTQKRDGGFAIQDATKICGREDTKTRIVWEATGPLSEKRNLQELGESKNLQVRKNPTGLYSADSQYVGVHGDPPRKTSEDLRNPHRYRCGRDERWVRSRRPQAALACLDELAPREFSELGED